MSATQIAAKYAPALIAAPLAPSLAVLPFHPWWLVFVPLGIVLGWMARAARQVGQQQPLSYIFRDLIISVLVGGGNALLAALIINRLDLSYLAGMAVAFGCAFGGIASVDQIARFQRSWAWLKRHLVDDIRHDEGKF